MDGTLINSMGPTLRVWSAWARRNGLDPDVFVPTIHGVRGSEAIAKLGLPGMDPHAEAAGILAAELDDLHDITPIAGVADFLGALPPHAWAIVTSAPAKLARLRLAAAGITPPSVMVTSEDVEFGKPHPQCFLLGAERLGVSASDCIVFEDAHAGITAGERAGAALMVISATHQHPIETAHASIHSYEGMNALTHEDGWISIRKAA